MVFLVALAADEDGADVALDGALSFAAEVLDAALRALMPLAGAGVEVVVLLMVQKGRREGE